MAKQHQLFRVEGDNKPDQLWEYESFDLTGYTVELQLVRLSDRCREEYTGIIDDANVGGAGVALFHFEFAAGDLITQRGTYRAEVEFTKGVDIFTLPRANTILIEVRADVL